MTDALLLMGLQALVGAGVVVGGMATLCFLIWSSTTRVGGLIFKVVLWTCVIVFLTTMCGVLGMLVMDAIGWNPMPRATEYLLESLKEPRK